MIEKLSILFSDLTKTKLSKKEIVLYFNNLMQDKRIQEVKKILNNEKTELIYNEIQQMNKLTKKACDLLLNDKLTQLYNFDKIIYNLMIKKNA